MEMFYPENNLEVDANRSDKMATLSYYLLFRSKGSTLITTINIITGRDLANGPEPNLVRSMTDEGRALLLSGVSNSQPESDLKKLLVTLEYMPLAISQAAAFIS